MSETKDVAIQRITRLKFLRGFILLAVLVSSSSGLSAKVLTFERGGAYNGTGIVDPGSLTLEAGIVHYADEFDSGGLDLGLGTSLFRYGIFDRFELRARNTGVLFNDSVIGMANQGLGFKYAILNEEHGIFPVINLMIDFQIPFGRDEFRNPGFNHSYELSMSHSITESFAWFISLTPSFVSREDINGDFSTFDLPYVFNLNYMPSDRLTFFTDLYGQWGFSSFASSPLAQDIGLAYAFTEDFAMDLTINWGLNESAPDFGIDCGFALRLLD